MKRSTIIVTTLLIILTAVFAFSACDNATETGIKADLSETTFTVKRIDLESAYSGFVYTEAFVSAVDINLPSNMTINDFLLLCFEHNYIDYETLGIEQPNTYEELKEVINKKLSDNLSSIGELVVGDKESKKITYNNQTFDYEGVESETYPYNQLNIYQEDSEKVYENQIGTISSPAYSLTAKGYYIEVPEFLINIIYEDGDELITVIPSEVHLDIPLILPRQGDISYTISMSCSIYWQILEQGDYSIRK